jgi:hypothetical protein
MQTDGNYFIYMFCLKTLYFATNAIVTYLNICNVKYYQSLQLSENPSAATRMLFATYKQNYFSD